MCKEDFRSLRTSGLMTIGSLENSVNSSEANSDFEVTYLPLLFLKILYDCKQELAKLLSDDPGCIELSMGMSTDFEQAV
ncbi:unnamed protein product [Protopolystoma xenopodis]|uniref:Uncharacterized protein n=1 Tax=Protopolystoma xenopodis TaxID=117903 RepID=A0A448WWX2_9PLAT|nr:unnamed protein product [Protopolystoma xenopodis]